MHGRKYYAQWRALKQWLPTVFGLWSTYKKTGKAGMEVANTRPPAGSFPHVLFMDFTKTCRFPVSADQRGKCLDSSSVKETRSALEQSIPSVPSPVWKSLDAQAEGSQKKQVQSVSRTCYCWPMISGMRKKQQIPCCTQSYTVKSFVSLWYILSSLYASNLRLYRYIHLLALFFPIASAVSG